MEERSRAASHPQPALQHRWPKASVTSPVKRGLEQRGSWGLKCRVSADRRLCWISIVHAPNGNLSLSLASILGVCFPSARLPCSSESPRDCFPVSAAPLSPQPSQVPAGEWKDLEGAWQKEPNPKPHPKPDLTLSPVGQLRLVFGAMGEEGGTHLPCPVFGELRQSKVQLASLLCCKEAQAEGQSTRKCY